MEDRGKDLAQTGKAALQSLRGELEEQVREQERENDTTEERDTSRPRGKPTPPQSIPVESTELTAEQAMARRRAKKARLAQVLSRGHVNDKLAGILNTATPKGRKGKFILDREESVIRYSNLGYSFEYTESGQKAHAGPDGRIRVGDVILMTIDEEDRSLLREVRLDRIRANLAIGRTEFMNESERYAAEGGGPAPFNNSVSNINIKEGR